MTIKDIAELAQVSKGTVSRVINGGPGVGDKTRTRILKLIESLDFYPNVAARGLAQRKMNTLGFIIPHTGKYMMTNTFWPILLTAITEHAMSRGINVLLSPSRTEHDVDSAFRSILRGKRIDGAIIGAEQFGDQQLVELLSKNLPFVTVGKHQFLSTYAVDADNEGGAFMAADYLANLGHTRIALLAGPEGAMYTEERVRGFRSALVKHGLDPSLVYHCTVEPEDLPEYVVSILELGPMPTALLIAAEDMVVGTLSACSQLGLSIPRDLSLVSFGDHSFFSHLLPPITAVRQPVEEMAIAAVDMLCSLIDGVVPERKLITLPASLLVRGSTTEPLSR